MPNLTGNLLIDTAEQSVNVGLKGLQIADKGVRAVDNAVNLGNALSIITGLPKEHLPQNKWTQTSYGDIRSAGVEKVREWNPVAGVAADVLAPNVVDLAFGAGKITKGLKGIKHGIKLTPDILKIARNNIDDLISPKVVATAGGPQMSLRIARNTAEQFGKANPLMIKGTKEVATDIATSGQLRRASNTLPQTRPELREQAKKLHVEEGMDIKDVRKSILGDEQFWTDLATGEKYAIHSAKGKGITLVGQSSRGQRGAKRTLMTEQQSLATGEQVFAKYNSKGNIVDLLIKEGDEIHHWNSLIDKAPAYKGLNTQQAKELTSMAREAGWFLGDHKNNLIKMTRGDHKAIHAWMRQNSIEGAKASKIMEKMYEGKSVKERFKIFRGFMEYVQGGVDEQLIKMGYSMPEMHKLAQEANRKLITLNK